MKVRIKCLDESYRRATRNFSGQNRFHGIVELRETLHVRHTKEGIHKEIFLCFFLKLHFKWKRNPQMHTNKVIFPKIRVLFVFFQKKSKRDQTPPVPCASKLIYFLKRGWYSTIFFFMRMSKFSKTSLSAKSTSVI